MEPIKFVDISRFHLPLRKQLHEAAIRVIDGGAYIKGPDVKIFESNMARWMGVESFCSTACGTTALWAAMKGLGVKTGGEVITTVHTAIATAEAVTLCGAKPVFCDLEPGYFFLSAREAEKKITPKTQALVPVHLYGQPVALDDFLELGRKYGIPVIEDCAQSQGARYKGKYVGTQSDAATFSFFPSKNLGGFGDGGAVTAKDPDKMKWMKMFSNHGRSQKYEHEFEGINSRLDTLQAALLNVCLPHLDQWNANRRRAALWYDEAFADLPQVTVPKVLPETEPIYHVYVILVPDRDGLQAFLSERQIETGIHYPMPLSLQVAYRYLNQGPGSFPQAEYACQHMLSLPMHPALTQEEVHRVVSTIKEYFAR